MFTVALETATLRSFLNLYKAWVVHMLLNSGHEDVDQYFSQLAAYLTPLEFSTPEEAVDLLDSSSRPESAAALQRKQAKRTKVCTQAYKLDEVANWKYWVGVLGIRLLGLRCSECQ